MIIGKEYKFSAAHYLPGHPKCGVMHGHTYTVIVEIEADLNSVGVILDFGELNRIMDNVLVYLDHRCLNDALGEDIIPTCEQLTLWIIDRLINKEKLDTYIINGKFLTITVREGEGGYAKQMYSLQFMHYL